MPLVEVRGLRMSFGGIEVVRGVDLDLHSGEVHAVVGENGAGKSTVAKVIAGVHRPSAGSISIGGSPVSLTSPRHALSLGMALIHQEPLTFPDLTVAENVFVGHQPGNALRGIDWREMNRRAQELLRSLRARFSPSDLAGGLSVADQQLVELAAALSHDAKALMMDETTAALTPKEVEDLFVIVRRLKEEGRAVLFVSHRLDEVLAISDRISVMRDGEKVAELKPSETNVAEIVSLMVGRKMGEVGPARASSRQAPVALEARSLTRRGRFKDVSLSVREGEIVGLAGLVGAGRTEVCECLFGVVHADAGSVHLFGKEVRLRSPRQALEMGLAMVPEDRQHHGLLLPLDISENVNLPTLRHVARGGFLNWREGERRSAEQIDRLGCVYRSVRQKAGQLSGGNQQKLVLAKWLLATPRVLILDEPTRGVDVGAKAEVHRLINDLAASGLAILLISSDLQEVLALSHRVLVMREGRMVAEFVRAEATPDRVMLAATGQVALAG